MADRGSRPGPSRREKGKAKVWEPIELDSDDDQTEKNVPSERNVPGPVPSCDDDPDDDVAPSPEEGYFCISRTLNSHEADPVNPVLYIDAYEAYVLTESAEFLEPPSASYSKILPVFDEACRIYNMLLSYYVNGDWAGYSITEDWGEFVRVHNLKAGDEIFFYRHINTDVLDHYYYDLKYVKKSMKGIPLEPEIISSVAPEEEKSPDRKRKPGPGSRVMPDEAICLSKTLSAFEVVIRDGKPRIFLDAYEAGLLIGCPDIIDKYPLDTVLLENLVVFDADDRPYDMLLSHSKKDDREIIYTVDDGWQRFVKIHNLKAGDEVSFYRLLDESVHDEPYYVLKYTRKELPSGSGSVIGKEPSGSGHA